MAVTKMGIARFLFLLFLAGVLVGLFVGAAHLFAAEVEAQGYNPGQGAQRGLNGNYYNPHGPHATARPRYAGRIDVDATAQPRPQGTPQPSGRSVAGRRGNSSSTFRD